MSAEEFGEFFAAAEPRLRRALVAAHGPDRGRDAAAAALAYAWANWERIRSMDHPVAYLYRVGQSETRTRRRRVLHDPVVGIEPWIEPRLKAELMELSERQRTAVVLVHAFDWPVADVAELRGRLRPRCTTTCSGRSRACGTAWRSTMDEVRSMLQRAADAACPPITVAELERAPRRSRLPRRGYLAAAAAAAVVVSGGVVWAQLGESSSGDVIAGPPRERADALGARIPGDRAEGGDPRVSFEPLPLGECGLAGRSGAASTAATDPEVCRVAQAAFDEGGASTEPMRFIGRTVVAGELHTAAARGGMGEVFGARSPDERITIHLVRAEEPVFSGKDALLVGSPGPSGSGELRRLALSSESAAFAELEGLILAR